ncbi:MAG: class I SAM-dependent methyltransferase [Kofleriaceae bacterium]|nr:class I SAM-dependent methyltransferase [Kofleriaceae bacterium]
MRAPFSTSGVIAGCSDVSTWLADCKPVLTSPEDRMALEIDTRPPPTIDPKPALPDVPPPVSPPLTSEGAGSVPTLIHDEPLARLRVVDAARAVPAPEAPVVEPPLPPGHTSEHRSWLRLSWRAKGLIQRALSALPGGMELHYLMQRIGGGLAHFDRECDGKVEDWRLMATQLRGANVDLTTATFVEVGTGWYPTFPLCLYLAGASRVLTYDTTRHMRSDMVRRLVARLVHHVPMIARVSGTSEIEVEARRAALARALGRGATLHDATWEVVDYRAPASAADTALAPCSVDVVFSNSVLEHVPPDALHAVFREAWRVLRAGGLMFHSVNCGDHYAYTDPSIDQLHYLAYSEKRWARWNNAFLYQNRLRSVEFTEAAREVGFAIERDTSRAKPERLAQLERITVDPCFAGYTREQLAITSIDFIARKPASR